MLTTKKLFFIGIILFLTVFAVNLDNRGLEIAHAQEQTGSISGTVVNVATDEPLAGIEVCAKSISHTAFLCATSSSTGVYTINGMPEGAYIIYIEQAGWALEYYDEKYFAQSRGEYDGADHVQVIGGLVTGGINFALDAGGSLSGTVTDDEGTPLSQIRVELLGFPEFYTCTDENGEYVLSGIPAEEEDLLVPRASVDPSCPNSHPDYAPETCLTCGLYTRETPSSDIDFTLELGGMISGTVTSEASGLPLEGIQVCAQDDNSQKFCGLTDADGDYTINKLPAFDAYKVKVVADGWALEYYNDNHQKRWAAAVPVVSAQTTSGINFALEPGGLVSGTVTDAEGEPLEGIDVAFNLQYDGFLTITDEYGHYEFSSIPDHLLGKALARSYDAFGEPIFLEYWEEVALESSASHIWFDEEHTEWTNVNFTLETLGVITGEVTGTGGIPLGDVKVCAIPYYGVGDDCAWTDVNGRYQINGLVYDPDGYKVFFDDGWLGRQYYDGKTESTADHVYITYGQTVDDIDFIVETGGSVSGVVRDAGGVPLNKMRVEIAGDDWKMTSSCTDENGRYIVLGVPYNRSFTVFASSSLCGSKRGYQPEYWQDVQIVGQAVELSVSAETPALSGIDFSLVEQSVPTTVGSNRLVNLAYLSLTFTSVEKAGVTWETQLPINPYYINGNFDLIGNAYEAATSAQYSTPVQVCLRYDDTGLGALEEQLRLFQYNETWDDITLSSDYLDMDENIICGSTETGLSTFAVLLPKLPPPENVIASDGSSTDQVTISWDTLSDMYSYRVFRTAPGGSEVQVGSPLSAVFNDTSAVPGVIYNYQVKVCIGIGDLCGLPSAAESGWRAQPEPLGLGSYDDTQIFYEGDWSITETSGEYGDTQHTSHTPGNFAVFFFEGRCTAVVFSGDPQHGVLDIYIDDVLVRTLNQYVRQPIRSLRTVPICVEEGQHVLKLLHVSGAAVDLNALIVEEPVEYEEQFFMPIFNGF